jgi:hypothetical protein
MRRRAFGVDINVGGAVHSEISRKGRAFHGGGISSLIKSRAIGKSTRLLMEDKERGRYGKYAIGDEAQVEQRRESLKIMLQSVKKQARI